LALTGTGDPGRSVRGQSQPHWPALRRVVDQKLSQAARAGHPAAGRCWAASRSRADEGARSSSGVTACQICRSKLPSGRSQCPGRVTAGANDVRFLSPFAHKQTDCFRPATVIQARTGECLSWVVSGLTDLGPLASAFGDRSVRCERQGQKRKASLHHGTVWKGRSAGFAGVQSEGCSLVR
jgi:hypothetical protein